MDGARPKPEAPHELLERSVQSAPTQVAEHSEPDPPSGRKRPGISVAHFRKKVKMQSGLESALRFRLDAKRHPAAVHKRRRGASKQDRSPSSGIHEEFP